MTVICLHKTPVFLYLFSYKLRLPLRITKVIANLIKLILKKI